MDVLNKAKHGALIAGMSVATLGYAEGTAEQQQASLLKEAIVIAQSGDIKGTLKNNALNHAETYVEEKASSLLGQYFNTVDLGIEFNDGKPEYNLGLLKAYDEENPDAFVFSQLNLNRIDDRTTLNLGLGYRVLNTDETWMGGVNAFYDHEFPYDHRRAGAGAELISSAVKIRGNLYWGLSDYKDDKNGTTAKALDGQDIDLELALPYLPGAAVAYNSFKWNAIDGGTDLEGKKFAFRANLTNNIKLEVDRIDYDDAGREDINRIQLNYVWRFGKHQKVPTIFDVSDKAFELRKLESERYDLVKRENKIIKQTNFNVVATGF